MRRLVAATGVMLAATSAWAGESRKQVEVAFVSTCQKMKRDWLQERSGDVVGKERWVVLTTELDYAGGGRFWGEDAARVNAKAPRDATDPLPAIVDFNAQLAARGITLIFMPVPTRILVYPEAILGREAFASFTTVPDLSTPEHEFFRLLRRRGVEAVELTPIFLANRDDPHGPLFVPSDSHWTCGGIALASAELARLIRAMPFYRTVEKQKFVDRWEQREHSGNIYRNLAKRTGQPERPGDRVWVRSCTLETAAGEKKLEPRSPDSPVVVIGDSNVIWWRDRDGALNQQLSADLGFPVDDLSTTGGGATNTRLNFVRTALSEPDYLKGKKVVVWCFTSRSFYNSHDGWRLVPLDRPIEPEPTATPGQ